jgi:exopolysaccharide biosynthesis protein
MDKQTRETILPSRNKQKIKRFRFLKVFLVSCLILLLCGGGFLYGTNQGLQIRSMLVGTVLSSSHPQYADYMHFLLSKSQIDELKKAIKHPKVVQSKINKDMPSFKGGGNNIEIFEVKKTTFTAKIMVIPDPTTVHLAVTKYTDKGQPLSELIKDNNGVAGINAGGFLDKGGNGSGGQMVGIAISNGKILHAPSGGKDVPQLIGGFLRNGQFITGNYSVNQLIDLGVKDAVHFGPQLVVNGKNVVSPSINAAWGWAPRTALGQDKDGKIVMIITDGRFYWEKAHQGATMGDMEALFESYHVTNAMSMDGGASTTMIKDGKLLLKPTTQESIGMRYIPNAWVVIPNE